MHLKPMRKHKLFEFIYIILYSTPDISNLCSLLCKNKTLDPEKVKGKIVACVRGDNARVDKGEEVLKAGGAGMILCNDKANGNEITADPHVLPASHLTYRDSLEVLAYINSSKYFSITNIYVPLPAIKITLLLINCLFTETHWDTLPRLRHGLVQSLLPSWQHFLLQDQTS